MEIGDLDQAKSPPILYIPKSKDFKTWMRVHKVNGEYITFEIFYKDLPPPIGLLLLSDMIYINRIVYYPKEKASIVYFNGEPIYLLRALLDKVKNV